MGIARLKPPPAAGDRVRAIPVIDERMDSTDIFRAERTVQISHGQSIYTLRLTSKNTLILTK